MAKGEGGCGQRPALVLDLVDDEEIPADYNSRELNFELVQTPEQANEALEVITDPSVNRIGVDIETTDSFKAWGGTTRLVQMGIELPEPRQFLIDVYHVDPARFLVPVSDPRVEIITCNGAYEQEHLMWRWGIVMRNVWDVSYTEAVLNKERGSREATNFKALMGFYPGLDISKEEQVSDWGEEELTQAQLMYAAMDVAGLHDIARGQRIDVEDFGLERFIREKVERRLRGVRERVEANLDARDDHVDKLLRAIDHSATVDELDEVRATLPRLAISYQNHEIIDAAYADRWAQLAVSAAA